MRHFPTLLAVTASLLIFVQQAALAIDVNGLLGDRLRGEQQMLNDAADGQLHEFTLFEAALLASGVNDTHQIRALNKQLEAIIDELRPQVDLADDPFARMVRVFELMHERVLTGEYQSDCTQLTRTLDEGNYNCVSATILFHVLCQAYDLQPIAVATPTHVYSRLRSSAGTCDIQTTCGHWFRLSAEQQRQHTPLDSAAAGQQTPRELTAVQLLAKVYYNNGVRELEQQHYEPAEAAFRISLQLDSHDQTARENLLAGLNNWALTFCDRGEFAAAARLLRRGANIDADYGPFLTNDLHIHQRWAQQLCDAGQFEQAIAMLEQGRSRQPEAPLFRDGPAAVYRMWAAALADRGQFAEAVRVLNAGLEKYPHSSELLSDRSRLEVRRRGKQSTTLTGAAQH